MPTTMQAIVSVTDDWAIGTKGSLAVRNREDMLRFKALTMGGTVVMGRKTLETFPGGLALPGRRNIVLTRDEHFERENVEVAHGLADVKLLVAGDENVWIIGGESVYRAFLPCCDRVLVTKNHCTCPGATAFFPNLDEHPRWRLASCKPGGVTEDGVPFDYLEYVNRF